MARKPKIPLAMTEQTKDEYYERLVGPHKMHFRRVDRALDSAVETRAVAAAIAQIIEKIPLVYNQDADRVFRRWLGDNRKVDVDLSVSIDGTVERVVLIIELMPMPADPSNLRIRVLRPQKPK